MKRIKFAYNEPMLGSMELDEPTKDLTEEDFLKFIEQSYPEAIDIEITEIEEIN